MTKEELLDRFFDIQEQELELKEAKLNILDQLKDIAPEYKQHYNWLKEDLEKIHERYSEEN